MKRYKVYIETTIPSYLTSKPSRDLIIAGNQQIASDWWFNEKDNYNLFISQVVIDECKMGDLIAAKKRLELLSGISILKLNNEIIHLASIYAKLLQIPPKSKLDALHLSIAIYYCIDYLLTWNCKHLAHGEVQKKIREYNSKNSLFETVILTPSEFMRR